MDGLHDKVLSITVRVWILDKHSGPNTMVKRKPLVEYTLTLLPE